MLIFSRKIFSRQFRAHFNEASDKSCPKMNRNSEVPLSFLELKPCKIEHDATWRKYENSIFEAVKMKFY